MNTIPTRAQVLGGTCQQPSAHNTDFTYYSNKLHELLNEYKTHVYNRDIFNAQVLGFEVRSFLATVRKAFKINNKDALLRLGLITDQTLTNILCSDFICYDSMWLLPNKNHTVPKRLAQKSPEHRKDKLSKKNLELSIQQKRKLKRNLFDTTLFSGVEHQSGHIVHQIALPKPAIFEKAELCMDDLSEIASTLQEVLSDSSTNSVKKTVEDLTHSINTFTNMCNEKSEGVNFKDVIADFGKTQDKVLDTVTDYHDVLGALKKYFPPLVDAGAMVLDIYFTYMWMTSGDQKYFWLFVATSTYLAYRMGNLTSEYLFSLLSQKEVFSKGVEQQSFQDFAGGASKFANLVLLAFAIKGTDKGKVDKFVSFLTTADKRNKTLEDMIEWCRDTAYWVLNFFLHKLGYDKVYAFKTGENSEADSIFGIYESILKRIDNDTYVFNSVTYCEILDLTNACSKFLKDTRETAANRGLIQQIKSVYTFCIAKRNAMADAHWQRVGYRPEPVCLVLMGEPGVGKTQSVEYISASYCASTLPESEHETLLREGTAPYVYVRQDENEFWEGYKNKHIITVFDDLGQRRSCVGQDDAYHNLIRAINSFPYQLHMAEMTKKENTMFNSRLVIVTTNVHKFDPPTLYSSGAINRRLRFKFKVIVKKEYATSSGEIDSKKLPLDENGVSVYDPSIVNEYLSIDEEGDVIERNGRTVHSFSDLMQMTLEEGAKHERLRNTKEDRVGSLIKQILANKQTRQTDIIERENVLEMMPVEHQGATLGKNLFTSFMNDMLSKALIDDNIYLTEPFTKLNNIVQDAWLTTINLMKYYKIHGNLENFNYIVESEYDIYTWWENEHRNVNMSWSKTITEALKYSTNKVAQFVGAIFNFFIDLSTHKVFILALCTFLLHFGLGFVYSYAKVKFCDAVYRSFNPETITEVDLSRLSHDHAEYFDSALPQSTTLRVSKGARKYKVKSRVVGHQGSSPVLDVLNVIQNNMYEFHVQKDQIEVDPSTLADSPLGDFTKLGSCIFTHGRYLLIPFHFAADIIDRVDFLAKKNGKIHNIVLCPISSNVKRRLVVPFDKFLEGISHMPRTTEDDEIFFEDYTLVDMPNYIPSHRDIRKHFISATESYTNPDIAVAGAIGTSASTMFGKGVSLTKEKPCMMYSKDLPPTSLEDGWAYRIPTVSGDCGSVLILSEGPRSRTVVGGIHVGGSTSRGLGFGQKVTREFLDQLTYGEAMLQEEFSAMSLPEPESSLNAVVQQGNFQLRGRISKKHNPYGNSKVMKSLLHSDNCDSYTVARNAPSYLKPCSHGNDPYTMALAAYCANASFGISDMAMDKAVIDVRSHVLANTNLGARIYSFDEAVKGVKEHGYFKSINRAASAGYPYSLDGITKKNIFGDGMEYDLNRPLALHVRSNCEKIIQAASSGQRMLHVYTDNLKDEALPKEKVAIHKTRLFCGSPLEYTIVCRMYFGSFMADIQKNCIELGLAIGVNPYSTDWHCIAVELLKKSKSDTSHRFGAGDYKRFDGSEISYVHWLILDIINAYYAFHGCPGNDIRRVLWSDLVNSNHIMGDTIYSWNNSLPSGHPLTSIVNSLYNHIAMAFCYYKIQESLEYKLTGNFYDNVYLIVMGDDNLFSVNDEAALFFTEQNISEKMALLGLTYTSDTKDGVNVSLRTLNEVSFLKRKFRMEHDLPVSGIYGLWCAPIELSVILETPMWYMKSRECPLHILKSNVETSLKELSLHGKEMYMTWMPRIRDLYKQQLERNACVYVPLKFIFYDEARLAVCEQDTIY